MGLISNNRVPWNHYTREMIREFDGHVTFMVDFTLLVAQLTEKFSGMVTKASLPCRPTQKPVTGPYLVPVESTLHAHVSLRSSHVYHVVSGTESSGRVVSTSASYSVGTDIKSRHGDRLH